MQDLLVAAIVLGCAAYAAWSLMPAAGRRALARRLATAPLPAAWRARFARLAQSAPGCGCDGCDAGASGGRKGPGPGGVQPVRIVRKPR